MTATIEKVFVTAYTWHDNTPPGSPDISDGCKHQSAGGTGTYADPWTLAVGWDDQSDPVELQFPRCALFYLPHLRGYAVVEDRCGDPPNTREKPCWTVVDDWAISQGATHQIDVWIGGQNASGPDESTEAAEAVTGVVPVIVDPADDLPVPHTGEIFDLWKAGRVPVDV